MSTTISQSEVLAELRKEFTESTQIPIGWATMKMISASTGIPSKTLRNMCESSMGGPIETKVKFVDGHWTKCLKVADVLARFRAMRSAPIEENEP